MARLKYTIAESDLIAAQKWIENKFNNPDFPDDNEYLSNQNAHKDYQLTHFDEKKLNDWCESYLDTEQWRKFKTSIRARRLRQARKAKGEKLIGIDLTFEAHVRLKAMAKANGESPSAFLIRTLNPKWKQLPLADKYPT